MVLPETQTEEIKAFFQDEEQCKCFLTLLEYQQELCPDILFERK